MGSTLSKKQKYGVILFCVGTGFLIGGLYFDGKIDKKSKSQQQQIETDNQVQSTNQERDVTQGYDQVLQQAKGQVNVEFQGDYLTMNSINQILQKSMDLAKPEYAIITLENRKQRREAKSKFNSQLYQQLVLDYNEQVENLIERKQSEFCQSLQITEDIFQESVMQLMENGQFQQFFMIQASLRQHIKEAIPSTKTLTLDQLKQIISYQIEIISSNPKDLAQMIQTLSASQETQQLIPLAVNTIIADYCYEKFQIEEEDMMKLMQNPDNFADQTMHNLMTQLETAMYQLMGPIS
ncbi:unnamed protein product [Paramecium primaurelia]|uniref:Transmembrane protein n=1 Tax=Paramecium primaurelia TaxID=5886 RepID=A0A8S1L611_PARPR|nr:unnamed protein product [Paramecium primaurelia]